MADALAVRRCHNTVEPCKKGRFSLSIHPQALYKKCMNGVERYLLKQLVISVAFVALTLTFAIWLSQSVRFVDFIVNRGLSIGTFLYFTALLMPSLVAVVLPIALFISVMFTYYRMSLDRELIVMRATGMSALSLGRPAIVLGLLVMMVGYGFNLYLLPVTYRQFADMKSSFRDDVAGAVVQEGKFNSLSDSLTVYVRARDRSGQLYGILAQDSRKKDEPVTYMAERGAIVSTPEGPRVVLVNGSRQSYSPETGKMTLLQFERHSVDLSIFSRQQGASYRQPAERFVHELLIPGDSEADRYYAKRLIAEGHNRLASPLLSITFTLIALACLLSGEFNRRGQVLRGLIAGGLVGAVQGLSFGLFSLAAKYPIMLPTLYINAIVPAAIALYWLIYDPRIQFRKSDDDGRGLASASAAV